MQKRINRPDRIARCLITIALSTLAAQTTTAAEKNRDEYDTHADHKGLAVAIDRQLPRRPDSVKRWTQSAWVQLSYVVTAEGRAVDPIVIDASGGIEFEGAVREATETWAFEPSVTGAELPLNTVNTRFIIRGRGKGTTRKFARHSMHIMKNLQSGNIERARRFADETLRTGGWNLYESTILYLMLGRIEGAEDDPAGQLRMYRRGLAVSDERSLRRKARIDLLEDIFELEVRLGQYATALKTHEMLKDVPGSGAAVTRVSASFDEINTKLQNDATVSAAARISAPCDCDAGVALWEYTPVRRTFSFANLSGNVERFEARCERERLSADVVDGEKWSLPDEWGYCQVFVFGEDGASFDFLGHQPENERDAAADTSAVARNHVLDNRSRSQ